uniref:Ig-like domain-containing protein n=1 Tax=Taeniopygia guttata TaxID=59729 RepID=A0A674GNK6_TAEGU
MWQLGVLIPLLGAGALRVTQDPGELQVTTGGTVALQCQVEVAESEALLRMEWVRDGAFGVLCATRLRFGIPVPLSPCPRRAPGVRLAWHPPRATLSLSQVQGNDSGRYLCRVTLEIPRHGSATGNGTELRVTPGTARDRPGPPGTHCAGGSWGAWGAPPSSWGWHCSPTAAVTGAQVTLSPNSPLQVLADRGDPRQALSPRTRPST